MNNRASYYLFCLGAAASLTLATLAQTSPQSANDDIVTMIQAGLPETVIVSKIQAGIGHWDTSVAALVALKKVGATDAELSAIALPPSMLVSKGPIAPQVVEGPHDSETPFMSGQILRRNGELIFLLPIVVNEYYRDDNSHTLNFQLVLVSGRPALVVSSLKAMSSVSSYRAVRGDLVITKEQVGYYPIMQHVRRDGLGGEEFIHWEAADSTVAPKTEIAFARVNFTVHRHDGDKFVGFETLLTKGSKFSFDFGNTFDLHSSSTARPFFDALSNNFDSTLRGMLQSAGVTDEGSLPVYTAQTAQKVNELVAVFNEEADQKHTLYSLNHPATTGGPSLLNAVQGVANMQQAIRDANAADATHSSPAQISAATNATKTEIQALSSVSDPSSALQPTTSILPQAQPGAAQTKAQPQAGKSAFNMNQTRSAQKPSTSATNTSATASSAGRVPSNSGIAAPPVAISAPQSPYVASTPPLTPGFTTSLPIDNCVQQTYVDDNLSFVNHCTQAAYVEWYIGARSGSGNIAPGETAHSGYTSADVVAANGSDYYACPRLYSPVDAKYQRITTAVKHYTCRQF